MVSSIAITRLLWHAGLDDGGSTDVPSIALNTWPRGSLTPDFHEAIADCLYTLATLNREMNGDVPSRTAVRVEKIPRSLVYAMTEIIRMIRDCQEHTQGQSDAIAFSQAARRIETAWSAVLAGDIDNVLEHVEQEEVGAKGVE